MQSPTRARVAGTALMLAALPTTSILLLVLGIALIVDAARLRTGLP
jgi:hypothetical protein